MITATFHALDENSEDAPLGSVVWDGTKATPSRADVSLLVSVAKSVNEYHDPEAAMRELPKLFGSAYLRAQIQETS